MNPNPIEPTLTFETNAFMLITYTLAFLNFDAREVMSLAVPITALVGGMTIAIFAMYFSHRRREQWHETARLALQKGQPIPTQLHDEERAPDRFYGRRCRGKNDLRKGIILLAVSAGLYFFFSGHASRDAASIAAIPGFIGLALIIYSVISGHDGRDGNLDDRPPRL